MYEGVTAIFRITGRRSCSAFQVRLLREPACIFGNTLFAEKNLREIYRRNNYLYTSPIYNIPDMGKENKDALQILLRTSEKGFYDLNNANLVKTLIVSRELSNLLAYAEFFDKQTFIQGLDKITSDPNCNDTMASSLRIFRQNALYNLPDVKPDQEFTTKPRPRLTQY